MLDIGWPELFLIAVITIVVVGPKELPRVVRTVRGMIRKIRGLAGEFQSTLDDMAREADIEDIEKEIGRVSKFDVSHKFQNSIDPSGTMGSGFDFDDPKAEENAIRVESQMQASDAGDPLVGDISESREKTSSPDSEYASPKLSEGPSKVVDEGKATGDSVRKSSTSS